ncbi:MAG: hypothetical protein ACRCS8_01250 [Brevinema sp.]
MKKAHVLGLVSVLGIAVIASCSVLQDAKSLLEQALADAESILSPSSVSGAKKYSKTETTTTNGVNVEKKEVLYIKDNSIAKVEVVVYDGTYSNKNDSSDPANGETFTNEVVSKKALEADAIVIDKENVQIKDEVGDSVKLEEEEKLYDYNTVKESKWEASNIGGTESWKEEFKSSESVQAVVKENEDKSEVKITAVEKESEKEFKVKTDKNATYIKD